MMQGTSCSENQVTLSERSTQKVPPMHYADHALAVFGNTVLGKVYESWWPASQKHSGSYGYPVMHDGVLAYADSKYI